jgi:hypothetical protein
MVYCFDHAYLIAEFILEDGFPSETGNSLINGEEHDGFSISTFPPYFLVLTTGKLDQFLVLDDMNMKRKPSDG